MEQQRQTRPLPGRWAARDINNNNGREKWIKYGIYKCSKTTRRRICAKHATDTLHLFNVSSFAYIISHRSIRHTYPIRLQLEKAPPFDGMIRAICEWHSMRTLCNCCERAFRCNALRIDSFICFLSFAQISTDVDCLRLDNEFRQYFQHSRITARFRRCNLCFYLCLSTFPSTSDSHFLSCFKCCTVRVGIVNLRPLPTSCFLPDTHTADEKVCAK